MNKTAIIGIVGAGTMGGGIAQVAATAGHSVILFDASGEAAERAVNSIKDNLSKLSSKGRMTEQEASDAAQRISSVSSLSAMKECSVVIEAIVEDGAIKKELFSSLEKIVSSHCILATNTSSLSVTSIASVCTEPGRLAGMHFFNPAPLMPLVEIIPGLETSEATIESVRSLAVSWNKVPVRAADSPGFIVNRIARPFYGEALRIYEEKWPGIPGGRNGMATIDWAVKEKGAFRMGPFELMDLIGNDVNYTVTETVWKLLYYDSRYRPSVTQKRMFESGRLGRKTGSGYYDYTPGASQPEPMKDEQTAEKIFYRILAMLINEAADAPYHGLASAEDIDLAMTRGVNYPKGLLKWCDEIGAGKILAVLEELHEEYREERYRPSVLLRKMNNGKKKFYN